jgi:hypothetical protein
MQRVLLCVSILLAAFAISCAIHAQTQSIIPSDTAAGFTTDYPAVQPGIFIQSSSWKELLNESPAKSKAAHGIAASLSYGAVPAKLVAEYAGEHAPIQVGAGQVTICICHILSLPGQPVIVRLQSKKGVRELDGGKMVVNPFTGGSKIADANKSDLISTDQAHPDPQIWLVRTKSPLLPGEYALMLGTQNLSIFPFSVSGPSTNSVAAQ